MFSRTSLLQITANSHFVFFLGRCLYTIPLGFCNDLRLWLVSYQGIEAICGLPRNTMSDVYIIAKYPAY